MIWIKNTIPSNLNTKYCKLASYYVTQKPLFKITNLLQMSTGKALTVKTSHRQNFLYVDLEHPKLIKNNILYSKALRIKQICTTKNDFNQYFQELKQQFINQGYKAELINKHKNSRKNCLEKTFKRISLLLKYNRTLPNISKVVGKHWNIFKQLFQRNFSKWTSNYFQMQQKFKENNREQQNLAQKRGKITSIMRKR